MAGEVKKHTHKIIEGRKKCRNAKIKSSEYISIGLSVLFSFKF